MNTSPIHASSTAAAAAGSGGGVQGLTTSDFLTLMTAQLKNQDPLNPTDSNQFLSQLAQLSTVTGISSMDHTMSSLSSALLSSQALSSATLVGHGILTPGSSATYSAGRPLTGAVDVPAGASRVTLTVTDAAGTIVRQISATPGSGLQAFSWDGSTDAGTPAPSGTYGITATAIVAGKSQAAATLLNGTVTSVSLDAAGSGVTLNTPELGAVSLGNVKQIS